MPHLNEYNVTLCETICHSIRITAESQEAAEQAAKDAFCTGSNAVEEESYNLSISAQKT